MTGTAEQQRLFKEIMEQHQGILFKVARTYCPDETDRQDLVQEIRIQVWQSLHRYDARFRISTWLYRIALNTAISHYRRHTAQASRSVAWQDHAAPPADEAQAEQEYNLVKLEQFIGELGAIDKALMLLYLEDKSHAEIAELLGLSVSNVGTKITRIRQKLKTRFAQLKS